VSVVVFDLDNTLIDRDGAVRAWLATLVPASQVDDCLVSDAGGYGDRPRFFRRVAAAAGVAEMRVRTRFRAELPQHVRALSGAHDLLARLEPHHRLAIATNGSGDLQRAKLAAAGFTVTWALVAISDEVGAAKPEAAFFRHLLTTLACAPQTALMVGDHPLNDIAGARQAGMRTCWLRTPHHREPEAVDQIVDRLAEVRP
jgi:HAD superfamily hydrolase (TIGR01493 family)